MQICSIYAFLRGGVTDLRADGQTDGRTDRRVYRGGLSHLNNEGYTVNVSEMFSVPDSFIILYIFLGVLGGIALVICLYKLAQNFSGEIKPKNVFGN